MKSETLSPSEIVTLRGPRSRTELAERLGVTPLTVYRWELPEDAPQARRPRGKVLARLQALVASERGAGRNAALQPTAAQAPRALPADELSLLEPALAAIDAAQLEHAELALVSLINAGGLRSDAARALASILLARLHLLVRHDVRSAFGTLLAVPQDLVCLPGRVQLEYHLTAAFLHAHADAQLFNPGKTHHHAALAEQLLQYGSGDHRFFLWYARYIAAVSLYEITLLARAFEQLPAVQDGLSTELHRCLAAETRAVSSLGMTNTVEAHRRLDEFQALVFQRGLPLSQLRALVWRAELLFEEAAPPTQVLSLLDEAEQILSRQRIANGTHVMMLKRDQGECWLRLGQHARAQAALEEALRAGQALSYTPIRIHTTLARLYLQTERFAELAALVQDALGSEDLQKELTRGCGRALSLLCDVLRGDASADFCSSLQLQLAELERLGIWPVAYRNLALLALAVVAPRASLRDVESLLQLTQRAIELSATASVTAIYRRLRATWLLRRGQLEEARQLLQAALATLLTAPDIAEAALVRRALANVATLQGAVDAEQLEHESTAELAGLGLPAPAMLQIELPQRTAAEDGVHSGIERVMVPLQRLTTRGVSEAFVHKELIQITAELCAGRHVVLQELAADGSSLELGRVAGSDAGLLSWFELGDGLGRSLRLGVGGVAEPGQRSLLQVIVTTAGMALEIAALRSLAVSTPRHPPPSEAEPEPLAAFVAASPAMRKLKAELARLSSSRATIIITGESGTGKEVIARAIHDLSRRAGQPYVTFNSAAIPRELFEGQLFGYRKGAFTGANADHPGVIRSAEGGTLFLDEIGELPLDVQPKLLRFLENSEVFPLGARAPLKVDVRVIAATHRDLRELVAKGRFREDLYYRLQVVPVEVPPLRARREDVCALARHFMRKLTPEGERTPLLTNDAQARLIAHSWPGNVRELRNVIERAMAFAPLPRAIGAAELHL